MEPTQRTFSIGYFIVTFVVLLAVQALLFAPHSENLSYRDFKALLKAGKVEDLSVSERSIAGRLKTEGLEGLLPPEKITELQPGKGGASLCDGQGR
jgi:cell division protease FtsH